MSEQHSVGGRLLHVHPLTVTWDALCGHDQGRNLDLRILREDETPTLVCSHSSHTN